MRTKNRLACAICSVLFAVPVAAVAEETLWQESFSDPALAGKGATGDVIDMTGISRWEIDISEASLTATSDWFRVENGVFEGRDLDGFAVWTSEMINIGGHSGLSLSLTASEQGDHESSDSFDVAYSVDGGPFITVTNWNGLGSSSHTLVGDIPDDNDWVSTLVEQLIPTGNTLQVRVTMRNNAGSEYLRLDDVSVKAGGASEPTPTLSSLVINEVLASHTGVDDTEFVELYGLPGTSLAGFSLISVEGEGSLAGTIDERIDFSSDHRIGANGFFLLGNADGLMANYSVTPNLDVDANLENGGETLALVRTTSLTGGVGNQVSGTEEVIDSLGLRGSASDQFFFEAPVVGPDGSYFPAGARRAIDGVDTDSASDWLIADFNLGADNTPTAGFNLVLNEILASHTGVDDTEYAELFGTPDASLAGISLLVVEGDSGTAGTIDRRIDFSTDERLGSNGLFLIGNPAGLSSNYGVTPDYAFDNNFFENSSLTVALVRTSSVSGTSVTGDEVVIDAIALNDGDSGDTFYFDAPVVGPDGSYFPAGASRKEDGVNTGSVSDFQLANFNLDDSNTPASAGNSGGGNNGGGNGSEIGECGAAAEPIWAIQGSGDTSPQAGQKRVIEGVVVGDFQSTDEGLRGFFLQEEDTQTDGDPATSDGIYVFDNGFGVDVDEGQVVRVSGTVTEYLGITEINQIDAVLVCHELTGTAEAAPLTLPEASNGDLERFEGMKVELQHHMTVAQTFFLGRYGQMTLASPDDAGQPGRLFNPTNQFPAGTPEAIALAEENARRILILDDGMDTSALGDNPVPVPYLPVGGVLRAGDRVEGLVGVLDYGRINSAFPGSEARDYRLHPTQPPVFVNANERTAQPADVGGSLQVASFNVLNYFNGDGLGGGFPTARGADTVQEFERQEQKIVNALLAMDADVVGLMEIENDGYTSTSAIAALVEALNQRSAPGTYAFVDPGTALWGSDAIAVGMIYKPAKVQIAADTVVAGIDSGEFVQNGGNHRKPMTATFEELATGERFTVVVNHLKSKGSLTGIPQDEDQGDGQGNNNFSRTNAANELADWLATAPTGSDDPDVMILGDLNAYAEEDPILALESKGYTDQLEAFQGKSAYSYIFDGQSGYLDHALANAPLAEQVTGVVSWPINADEPAVIDYDQDFNPQGYFDGTTSYRASDHDPVLVGLALGAAPLVGDVNGDGLLDYADFSALATAMGSLAGEVNYLEAADLDGDGDVDFVDYQRWYQIYQSSL